MRTLTILATLAVIGTPALADSDAEFQKQAEGLVSRYMEAFNAKNADGVMALFASDGVYLAADGHTETGDQMRKSLEGAFAAGLHDEGAVTQAHRYGTAGFGIGTYSLTIPGKPFKSAGTWNAAYIIEGDQLKLKLLAASVPPPAPK
jgi:ketosteroid isomerase-like protein